MPAKLGLWVCWGALVLGCGSGGMDAPRLAPPRTLVLLHSSDLHSHLWPFQERISSFEAELGLGRASTLSEVGGAARLATLLGRERAQGAALWLDSGDALEGAPIFQEHGGSVELALLQSLGLAAMALGNHELSLSGPALAALLAGVSFPVLAADVTARAGSPLAPWLQASALLSTPAGRVLVVGVANVQSPPNLASPGNPWDLVVGPDLAASVQVAIDDAASRAALVVVLSHLGLDGDRALLRATTGIDLVLGGHQHIVTAEPEWQLDCTSRELQELRGCSPRRVAIVHSGAYGQWLSRLELGLRPEPATPGELEVDDIELRHLPVGEAIEPDPGVAAYLEQYRPPPEPPLGFLPAALSRRSALGGDSALGNLSVDALRWQTGADVVLLNSSGLRTDLEAGLLLRGDLSLAFPFEEPWRLVWLSGAQLRVGLTRSARKSAARDCESALQVAGLRLEQHCSACESGSPACLRAWRGQGELRDQERLLVALPAYLTLAGADFELATGGADVDVSVSDAIAGFVAGAPPGDASACARAVLAGSPERCAAMFGVGCPASVETARAVCRRLPEVKGMRDGRVEMLP
jgi:5'-nucleotidase / UDP-sugar diphosphatase